MLKVLKKVLSILTDILLVGRNAEWWKRRGGIPKPPAVKDPREGR